MIVSLRPKPSIREAVLRDEPPMDAAKARDNDARSHSGTNSTIFSQLRNFSNNLAVNSIGSLFNSTASSSASSSSQNLALDPEAWNTIDLPKPPTQLNTKRGSGTMEEGVTPTPTRPSSPRRFASVKHIFSNLASRSSRNPQTVQISVTQTETQIEEQIEEQEGIDTPRYEPLTPLLDSEFTPSPSEYQHELGSYSSYEYQQQLSASGSYGSSELDDTPPLTPESLVTDISLLSPASHNAELDYDYAYDYNERGAEGCGQDDAYMGSTQVDEQYAYMRPHSTEIKEGKKPERPIVCRAASAGLD